MRSAKFGIWPQMDATQCKSFVERLDDAYYNGRVDATARRSSARLRRFAFLHSTSLQVPWNKTPPGRHDSTLQEFPAGETD